MIQQNEILNSKISVPDTAGAVFRERLSPFYRAILENKITVVTAATGYGKSTFVAQALTELAVNASWYHLEESDLDPATFIHYLIAGIQKNFPELGEKTRSALYSATSPFKVSVNLLSVLINEIESAINEPYILVFDDCHEVAGNPDITFIMQFLADHLPDRFHLVMTSCIASTLSLSKYRANLDVNEVYQANLAFSPEEIMKLFSQLLGFIIPQESVNNLYRQTEGWVSGQLLFYHLAKNRTPAEIEGLLSVIKSDHRIFSEYMNENVYEQQSPEIKKFLIETSFFTQIDAAICNEFLGISDSGEILDRLVKDHLFTSLVDEENRIYAYHKILGEFLTAKAESELGSEYIRDAHKRAAVLFEKSDRENDALNHFLRGGHYEDVFRLLKNIGNKFFYQDRRNYLNNFLDRIPSEYFENEPWPLALKARLLMTEGKLLQSVEYSRKAYEIFMSRGMKEDSLSALTDLGRGLYLTGDFVKANETFGQVIEAEDVSPPVLLDTLGSLIFINAFLGRFEPADRYYKTAVEKLKMLSLVDRENTYLSLNIGIQINYGFRLLFSGNFVKSLLVAETVAADVKTMNAAPVMALYYHLLSINYFFLGKLEKALKYNNKSLAEVEGKGFYGTQEAWSRLNGAAIFLQVKDYDKAQEYVDKGLKKFRAGGSVWGEVSMTLIAAAICYKKGEMGKALEMVNNGLKAVEGINLPWVEGKFLYYSAIERIHAGDFSQADRLLKKSEEILSFSLYELCVLKNLRAVFYHAQGMEKEALRTLEEALETGERNTFGTWVFSETVADIGLFLKLYAAGRFKSYIIQFFSDYWNHCSADVKQYLSHTDRELRLAASEILIKMPEESTPPLGVCCLGKFRVFVGSREVLHNEWKSNKAREIFKYLVLSGTTPVHKDVLVELIWPDQDSEKTLKRLHVALPALRKALEPDVRKGASAYLVRENDHYRIEKGEGGFLDSDLFLEEIRQAEQTIDQEKKLAHLLQAIQYYQGDFLEEDLYLEWCFEEREHLKQKYLFTLEQVIRLYERRGENQESIRYCEKYLEKDPYSESRYKDLMNFHMDNGNFAEGLKVYEKCHDRIVKELASPLCQETVAVYEKLVKSKNFLSGVYK